MKLWKFWNSTVIQMKFRKFLSKRMSLEFFSSVRITCTWAFEVENHQLKTREFLNGAIWNFLLGKFCFLCYSKPLFINEFFLTCRSTHVKWGVSNCPFWGTIWVQFPLGAFWLKLHFFSFLCPSFSIDPISWNTLHKVFREVLAHNISLSDF